MTTTISRLSRYLKWCAVLVCLAWSVRAESLGSGNQRVLLTPLMSSSGFAMSSHTEQAVTFQRAGGSLIFEKDSRRLLFNGVLICLNDAILKRDDTWSLSSYDADNILIPLLCDGKLPRRAGTVTLVLDPGHGGRDRGALGNRGLLEKKITLDIAKRVRKQLQTQGMTVRLTRERDYALPLQERTARARKWRADLLISIHCNSAANPDARGVETYILPGPGFPSTAGNGVKATTIEKNRFAVENTVLAHGVHRGILARTGAADRGIRLARFEMLRNADCPALLIECGFVSNAMEEGRLAGADYREAIAGGIAGGIASYVLKTGTPSRTP